MNTTEKIELAKREVTQVEDLFRVAYAHGIALRQIVSQKELEIAAILSTGGWADPLNPMNDGSFIMGLATSAQLISLPILKALLEVSEGSENFKTGFSIIQPIVNRIADLEAELEAEVAAYAHKANASTAAQDAAVEKAVKALENDPALAKARQAAEVIRPPHIAPALSIFRGKVDLALTREAVA